MLGLLLLLRLLLCLLLLDLDLLLLLLHLDLLLLLVGILDMYDVGVGRQLGIRHGRQLNLLYLTVGRHDLGYLGELRDDLHLGGGRHLERLRLHEIGHSPPAAAAAVCTGTWTVW